MNKTITITKASGNRASFSEEKLRHSLKQAGANSEQVEYILGEVIAKLYDGISTKKIYHTAFSLLRDSSRHLAARYHLKKAIMSLGPSGYPFEKFVAEIFAHKGYKTSVSVVLRGKCVDHEIDVIAEKENEYLLVECKYHNQSGIFCDVKIPLYIKSRFVDVVEVLGNVLENKSKNFSGWIATNTRFSEDAQKYGICSGLHLLGWDFPTKNSLKDLIDTHKLYPVTCLTSLTKKEKQYLLDKKIVLCKEIKKDYTVLNDLNLREYKLNTVKEECEMLCSSL